MQIVCATWTLLSPETHLVPAAAPPQQVLKIHCPQAAPKLIVQLYPSHGRLPSRCQNKALPAIAVGVGKMRAAVSKKGGGVGDGGSAQAQYPALPWSCRGCRPNAATKLPVRAAGMEEIVRGGREMEGAGEKSSVPAIEGCHLEADT